jgi:sulfate-transporting ATPase
MGEQYIFTIENLSKAYNKREVLKNIWLAFYPGAKIGVIGPNGSGKSTLLRIMAVQDTDFLGTARLTDGFSVGFVPQEPQLTPAKTVLENVEEAVAGTRALLAKQEEIGNKMAEASPPRSTRPTPTTSTGIWKSPWTPCACRPAMPRSSSSPAASGVASPYAR